MVLASTWMDRVANSTPMVDLLSRLNSLRVNRERRFDFPTPESPMRTTLNRKSYSSFAMLGVSLLQGDKEKDAALVGRYAVSDSFDQRRMGEIRSRQGVKILEERVECQIVVNGFLCFGCLKGKR